MRMRYTVPVPTAIGRLYTASGFVISSDGLTVKDDGSPYQTDAQKIFTFGANLRVSHAFTGHTGLSPKNNDNITFWFYRRARAIVERLVIDDDFDSLLAYAKLLGGVLHRELKGECDSGNVWLPDDSDIVDVLIDGYHRGTPARARINLIHSKQSLLTPIVEPETVSEKEGLYFTSCKVGPLLRDDDSRFHKYKRELKAVQDQVLSDAVDKVYHHIKSLMGAEALGLHADFCSLVGGTIQIATITPNEDFKWAYRGD